MKILYAIQGTGNGHLSRARDIIPLLEKKGELDILISGIQADVELPYPIKYKFKGLSFIFGKKGSVDILVSGIQAFEWAEGYHPGFGLVHVNFLTNQRIIKSSGYWYQQFFTGNTCNARHTKRKGRKYFINFMFRQIEQKLPVL